MAVKPQIVTSALGTAGRTAGNHINFICSLEADLPSTGVIDGDTAYAADTGNPFTRAGGVWVLDTAIPVVAVRLLETGGPTSLLIGNIGDGQHLIRSGTALIGANEATLVSKVSTESILSSTVLHNDATLHFAMLANTTYRFRLTAYYDTAIAADFKFRHSGPASPVSVRIFRFTVVPSSAALNNIRVDTAYSAADVVCVSASANGGYVVLDGAIENGVNAGDFNFQWAQNTSTALATSVLKGSNLDWRTVV